MKRQISPLCALSLSLTAVLLLAGLAVIIAGALVPNIVLPALDIPTLAALSLIALALETIVFGHGTRAWVASLGVAVVDFGLLHIIAYILELLALVFAACCFTCMQFYSAMAIGYSFSNHKLLLSVVFFFAINVALSILQPLLLVFTGNAGLLDFMANSAQNISGPAAVHLVLLGAFLYALVFFAVLYIPTRLLLKRRLNLP